MSVESAHNVANYRYWDTVVCKFQLATTEHHWLRSALITADTAEYELDPVTGGNLPMSSTAQRVLIVVTTAQHDQRGGFITDPDRNKTRRAIRAALEPLIKDGSITVRDDAVELVNPSQGVEQGVVNYKSIKQGIDQSVQLD